MIHSLPKRVFVILLILISLPFFLTLIYSVPSVRPVSTLMVSHIILGDDISRDWVRFDDISPFLWQSVMMSEDGRFCEHRGVDWTQVNIVIEDVLDGERPRGASTIPMQLSKNLYLWVSRSYVRKFLEVPLAFFVDLVLSKRRIMEIYLNVAEWDSGIFGIESASLHYFGRSSKNLTRRQAALLAVTLPNPRARDPSRPGRGLSRLARDVEDRARYSGAYIGCLQ